MDENKSEQSNWLSDRIGDLNRLQAKELISRNEALQLLDKLWDTYLHLTLEKDRISVSKNLNNNNVEIMVDNERNQVFISYSHKDRKWLQELRTTLTPLIRNQTVLSWDDSQIVAGSEWRKEIEKALNSAKVAVLMVSPNFLESEFIAERELPQLLKAAKEENLVVLWVHVSHCMYGVTEIEIYQSAHDPSRPLRGLKKAERDQVLVKICEKIQKAYNS